MAVVVDFDEQVEALEARMAVAVGVANAAAAELVSLVADGLAEGLWGQGGVMSPEHWVGWQAGLSPGRARQTVAAARRIGELPVTMGLFTKGLLSPDQVAAIVRFCPSHNDAEVADFARVATVTQLRRVMAGYGFDNDARPPKDTEPRSCTFGTTDRDSWRLTAECAVDEGARVEATLIAIHAELFDAAGSPEEQREVTWFDALLEMADRASGKSVKRGFRDRHRVIVHVGLTQTGEFVGHLHLGSPLADWARRYMCCDATITPILESLGLPAAFGASTRTVSDRLRTVIENRDRGCRVPGCTRTLWLHVHHIVHWQNGGPTVTPNLICLCQFHHRLHHRGLLGIEGNADQIHGMVFTNQHGRVLPGSGTPAPPGAPPPQAADQAGIQWQTYEHPLGERCNYANIWFSEPPNPN